MAHDIRHRGAITFDLGDRDTFPLLVNALSAYAEIIDAQSATEARRGEADYSRALARTADQAREMVDRISRADDGPPASR